MGSPAAARNNRLMIQPEQLPGGVQPYPYYVDPDGSIGRQDKWRGTPAQLLGFQRSINNRVVDLTLADFASHPGKALGMYPVFADDSGNMFTFQTPVAAVRGDDDSWAEPEAS